MKLFLSSLFFGIFFISVNAQNGWKPTNGPVYGSRIDDIFMLNPQTGYAVCGDGKIVKTVDGGENWNQLLQNSSVYCRSVEFINTQKGFVGAFPVSGAYTNILRRTVDGGATWTDLNPAPRSQGKSRRDLWIINTRQQYNLRRRQLVPGFSLYYQIN